MQRILIEPTRLGARGQLYRAIWLGAIIVEESRQPVFAACRVLHRMGMNGTLAVYRAGRAEPDMQLNIGRGAWLRVRENDEEGRRSIELERWTDPPSTAQTANEGDLTPAGHVG